MENAKEIGKLEGRVDSIETRINGLEQRMFDELRSIRDLMSSNAREARSEREDKDKAIHGKLDGINLSIVSHMATEEAVKKTAIKTISMIAAVVASLVSGAGWIAANVSIGAKQPQVEIKQSQIEIKPQVDFKK